MIDRDEIDTVAANARLILSDEEADALQDDLAAILDSFDGLDNIDTEDVEPAFHPVKTEERTRDDTVEECLTPDEAFQNTENIEDGYFKGPRST